MSFAATAVHRPDVPHQLQLICFAPWRATRKLEYTTAHKRWGVIVANIALEVLLSSYRHMTQKSV
jgi:hypothetical protein